MERIRLAPLRLARAARVLDLDVEDAVALRRADADDVGRPQPGVPDAVGHQLGGDELRVAQLALGHAPGKPAAQDCADLLGGLRAREDLHVKRIDHGSPSWTTPMGVAPCDPFRQDSGTRNVARETARVMDRTRRL